uniref:(northern house mosquito) hypothetical protein n=1 Tax=Culex pipiens TaxID=7175 RepID=A0A8D8IG50_CULPI
MRYVPSASLWRDFAAEGGAVIGLDVAIRPATRIGTKADDSRSDSVKLAVSESLDWASLRSRMKEGVLVIELRSVLNEVVFWMGLADGRFSGAGTLTRADLAGAGSVGAGGALAARSCRIFS